MSATIDIPGPLRAYAAGARELAVDAATVGEALAHLAARYPRLGSHLYADDGTLRAFVNVYVNDEDVRFLGGLATTIGPGDAIVIVPSVAGGAPRSPSAPRATEPRTLIDAFESAWCEWPDRVALRFGDRSTTYAQLGDAAGELARAYRRMGMGRGDRVVCSVSNRPEHLVALAAAWTVGALHVGADFQFTAPELSRIVELTGAAALVYEPPADADDPFAVLRAVRESHPNVRAIVVGDFQAPEGCLALSNLVAPGTPGTPRRGELPRDAESFEGPAPEDPALIFISSGTTGTPKATLGYHDNLAQRWQRLADRLRFGPDDVHLAHLPLSHGFGMMMAMGALLTGGTLVLLDHFTARDALRLVEGEGVTVLNGAPAHFKLILGRLAQETHPVSTVRLGVGTAASFPPELIRSIQDRLGAEFMYMYGSSEGVGVATTDPDDVARGSVGRPLPGSAMIVDEARHPRPTGEVGEIAFSRRVYPVRYWGAAGPEAAQSEWFYSGDLGRIDAEGRLYILGRVKHQIDRGGLKVDPVEVEGALMRLPEVADAAVIGLPNPILGETVCACVVPAPDARPELEWLRIALGRELAPYKLPEELYLLEQIPRTSLGKVDLPKLRAEAQAATRQQLAVR